MATVQEPPVLVPKNFEPEPNCPGKVRFQFGSTVSIWRFKQFSLFIYLFIYCYAVHLHRPMSQEKSEWLKAATMIRHGHGPINRARQAKPCGSRSVFGRPVIDPANSADPPVRSRPANPAGHELPECDPNPARPQCQTGGQGWNSPVHGPTSRVL